MPWPKWVAIGLLSLRHWEHSVHGLKKIHKDSVQKDVSKRLWLRLDVIRWKSHQALINIVYGLELIKDISVLLQLLVLKRHWKNQDVMCIRNLRLLLKSVYGSKTIHRDHAQKDVYKRKCLKLDVIILLDLRVSLGNANGWNLIRQHYALLDVNKSNWLVMTVMEIILKRCLDTHLIDVNGLENTLSKHVERSQDVLIRD